MSERTEPYDKQTGKYEMTKGNRRPRREGWMQRGAGGMRRRAWRMCCVLMVAQDWREGGREGERETTMNVLCRNLC